MNNDAEAPPTTFEEAFEQLRKSIEELEGGPLPLDAAMARYEAGMRLARLCNEMLDKAELRIQHILRSSDDEGR